MNAAKQIAAAQAITDEVVEDEARLLAAIAFRSVGFSETAQFYPRDAMALAMLAAFNNVRPDQVPPAARYFPNASMQAAWGRVADAAAEHMLELLRDCLSKNKVVLLPRTPTKAMVRASCAAMSPGKRKSPEHASNAKKHAWRLSAAIRAGKIEAPAVAAALARFERRVKRADATKKETP